MATYDRLRWKLPGSVSHDPEQWELIEWTRYCDILAAFEALICEVMHVMCPLRANAIQGLVSDLKVWTIVDDML